MSAFICSNKTTSRVASLVYNALNGFEGEALTSVASKISNAFEDCKDKNGIYLLSRIFTKLLNYNIESVNYRYSENTALVDFSEDDVSFIDTNDFVIVSDKVAYQSIMSCNCWLYQSCEKSTQGAVYKAVEALSEHIANNILLLTMDKVRNSSGYRDSVWDE